MGKRAAWLILLLSLASAVAEARLVSTPEVERVAARLVTAENLRPHQRLTRGDFFLQGVEPLYHRGALAGYLARLQPAGFMIMADITEGAPQMFVSYDGDFEAARLHPFMEDLLDRMVADKAGLRYLSGPDDPASAAAAGSEPDRQVLQRNQSAWSHWLDEADPAEPEATPQATGEVAPLLTSRWNQNAPFNDYTPRVNGVATYTGCVATAQAQLMHYWKFPPSGMGSNSYYWSNGTAYQVLSADFNHPYYWDRMLDSYSSGYTAEQADAVARLMSDVGIALNMNYGTSVTSGYLNMNNSLFAFFKYSGDEHYVYRRDYPDWTAWFEVFRAQADLGRPALLATFSSTSSIGHAVVIDGYRTSPASQVHVNMGWSGAADNYYDLSNLYGYGSATSDGAVVDIHPGPLTGLTLTSPRGGDGLLTGSTQTITWRAVGYDGPVRLVLFNGSTKLGTIASGLPAASGTYDWTVGRYNSGSTAPAGYNYRIRLITADNTLEDWSETFAMAPQTALWIVSPNGGEHWMSGTTRTVRWRGVDLNGVQLGLYQGSSQIGWVSPAVSGQQGEFSWNVGSLVDGGTAVPGGGYKIRIHHLDEPYVEDASDGSFVIDAAADLKLTSPNGGEKWALGSSRAITWEAGAFSGTVRLILFRNGAKVGAIASVSAAARSFAWTAGQYLGGTAAAGGGYAIRLRAADGSQEDYSDASFALGN